MMKQWGSLGDLARETATTRNRVAGTCNSWTGYRTHEQVGEMLLTGDVTMAARCERGLNKLDNLNLPLLSIAESRRSPFGGRVNMGEWMAGSPTPMRRRVRHESEIAPIKVFVGITCSVSIKAPEIERRGVAVLALLRKIQQVRPVELLVFCETQGETDGACFTVAQVDSKPLELATAAVALCHVGVARHLFYGWSLVHDGFNGMWPDGYQSKAYYAKRKAQMGIEETDLVLESLADWDRDFDNPEKWIMANLRKLGMLDEG